MLGISTGVEQVATRHLFFYTSSRITYGYVHYPPNPWKKVFYHLLLYKTDNGFDVLVQTTKQVTRGTIKFLAPPFNYNLAAKIGRTYANQELLPFRQTNIETFNYRPSQGPNRHRLVCYANLLLKTLK